MRLSTAVALSTLSLSASAIVLPPTWHPKPLKEQPGHGTCDEKDHHQEMSPSACLALKGVDVLGFEANHSCLNKAEIEPLTTAGLHSITTGKCYYVEPKQARDLDSLEARGAVKAVLLGAGGGLLLHHIWKKFKTDPPASANAATPPAPERRDLDTFEARDISYEDDLDVRDLFWMNPKARDLDVLERRRIGKVILGAGLLALGVHEFNEHHPHSEDSSPAAEPHERRSVPPTTAAPAEGSAPKIDLEEKKASENASEVSGKCPKDGRHRHMFISHCLKKKTFTGFDTEAGCLTKEETEQAMNKHALGHLIIGECHY